MNRFILLLKAVLYGIIEGITEWLPISSTGHMIIIEEVLHLKTEFSKEFFDLFIVLIQLGAICAVFSIYFKRIWPFDKNKEKAKDKRKMLFYIFISTIPAGIVGVLLDDIIDSYFYNYPCVAFFLILYGMVMLRSKEKGNKEINLKYAICFGLFQVLALFPGTSRSGIILIGGLMLGFSLSFSLEYSFLLSMPIMIGASTLKLFKYLSYNSLALGEIYFLLIGAITSYLISVFVIKYILEYVKTHNIKVFGIYRIVLGFILILFYFLR